MTSTTLRSVADPDSQAELALARPANNVAVPIEMVRAKRSAGAAFTLACDASGLDDKEIYLPLGIDKGYFSRIKSGSATLDAERIGDFCSIVNNTIYPEWIAFQVRCTLVVIKSEAERRAEEAQSRADRAENENKLLRELLQGRLS